MDLKRIRIPRETRGLRACLVCSLVKSFQLFEAEGCDNCDHFLHMKGNHANVYDCTSTNFKGIIAAMNPEESWVCKWQRIDTLRPGIYAISVAGRLPADIVNKMQRNGIFYRRRDNSKR